MVQETFSSHDRCIYVLVWDLTNSYSQKRIEHWYTAFLSPGRTHDTHDTHGTR